MKWSRSETIALASQKCSHCYGLGTRPSRGGTTAVCHCVCRAIFREVHARFRYCACKAKYISKVSLESNPGRQRKSIWGMKNEEFMADFVLIAKRALGVHTREYRLFKWHFLLGADWRLVLRKLKIRANQHNRGNYFHAVYRIESALGRAFAETEPYGLWPLDEYFGGTVRAKRIVHPIFAVESGPDHNPAKPLKFPLRAKAA